jgi:hypothetical protein
MHIDLDGEWYGWKLRGRDLVSPDRQRMSRHRLEGLLWRDSQELRLAGFASRRKAEAEMRGQQYGPRVKVVVIDLAEYRVGGLAAG